MWQILIVQGKQARYNSEKYQLSIRISYTNNIIFSHEKFISYQRVFFVVWQIKQLIIILERQNKTNEKWETTEKNDHS